MCFSLVLDDKREFGISATEYTMSRTGLLVNATVSEGVYGSIINFFVLYESRCCSGYIFKVS